MSYQNVQTTARILLSTLHTRVVTLLVASCILIMLLLVACIVVSLKRWRDEEVQWVLMAEREQQRQASMQANAAEREKQHRLKLCLQVVWDEGISLKDEIFRSTQLAAEAWAMYEVCGGTPSVVQQHASCPFHVEITTLVNGLKHLNTMAEKQELRQSDLDFYSHWLEKVKLSFTFYRLGETRKCDAVHYAILRLHLDYIKLGYTYCLTRINPAYQRFPGMLHVLETLVDDHSITYDVALEHASEMKTQLSRLKAQYERGIL